MSTGNRFPVPKTPEERAEYVAQQFERCGQHLATQLRQLRRDFRLLKKAGGTIMECKNWTEFCKKVLKRTTRAVGYAMKGGNPRSKRKSPEPKDDWLSHWQNMPEFDQPDATPFKSIYVHFESQESVDRFAKLVGQIITPKTRYIYYPKQKKGSYSDKAYVNAKRQAEVTL